LPRVLIADDDVDVLRVFSAAVGTRCEVRKASGGAQAIAELEAEPYDLLLLDLHMAEVDGFAVLEHLRTKATRNRDIPVIVVTADPSDASRARALRSRSVYFLSKPVPLRVLTEIVDSTLARNAVRASRPPKD
jgi:CheY-like chemotaxis protein